MLVWFDYSCTQSLNHWFIRSFMQSFGFASLFLLFFVYFLFILFVFSCYVPVPFTFSFTHSIVFSLGCHASTNLTFRFRLSVFAQMRLADLATAWLRDDTHETLVSTMPYWEHCPWLAGNCFFLGGGREWQRWLDYHGWIGWNLKNAQFETRKGSEVGDAPNVYLLYYSQLPFQKLYR